MTYEGIPDNFSDEQKALIRLKRKAVAESNNSDPCTYCGLPNCEHIFLTREEIRKYRRMGSPVTICDEAADCFERRCYIHPPPANPCDEEHMLEISS